MPIPVPVPDRSFTFLVFLHSRKIQWIDQTKVSRGFRQILQEAGLPEIRFHDLRHTSLSFLLENGIPVNTLQSRAGHSKASVTTDIYGHTLARSQQEAARLIEQIINPLPNELLSE
jgi:integrase